MHRHVQRLADNIETSELDGCEKLRAVVVEACGRVGDQEAERFESERVVPDKVVLEHTKACFGALAAAAHLAQSGDPHISIDFDDGAHETAPMAPVGVTQRALKWDRDSRRADVRDANWSAHRRLLLDSISRTRKQHSVASVVPGARTTRPCASGPGGRLWASTAWLTGSKQKNGASAEGEYRRKFESGGRASTSSANARSAQRIAARPFQPTKPLLIQRSGSDRNHEKSHSGRLATVTCSVGRCRESSSQTNLACAISCVAGVRGNQG